jgi:hypothetical protein
MAGERDEYDRFAEQAAALLTPSYIKRGKRIMKLGPIGTELYRDVQSLFQKICDQCDRQVAVDMFEQIIETRPPKKPPGKRKGAHDQDRDMLLLGIFDKSNPQSFVSLAKQGLLTIKAGEPPRPHTEKQFAERLVDTPAGRGQWRASSGAQILRRVKQLRKNMRALSQRTK